MGVGGRPSGSLPPSTGQGQAAELRAPRGPRTLSREPSGAMDLYRTPAAALDSLVLGHLQPPAGFVRDARRALGDLGEALRNPGGLRGAGGQAWRVLKMVKGGSSGRGTALRGGCDAELVVFLDCFKCYEDQQAPQAELLSQMRALLAVWWLQRTSPGLSMEFPEQDSSQTLRFRLASSDQDSWLDVTLVPAFDALGQLRSGARPRAQVYSALLLSGCRAGEHAACFSELRRSFVNTRPAKLKSLILLVKHWYHQVLPQEVPGDQLPPAYALELLTIFAWEQGCGESAFSLARGLRTVLGLIERYQHLCICWTLNYSPEDPALAEFLGCQLKRPRPVILDPADPTWDLGGGAAWRWDLLAREAQACTEQPCFRQAEGAAVLPWQGPGLPRLDCPGLDHPIQRNLVQRCPQDTSGSQETAPPKAVHSQHQHPDPARRDRQDCESQEAAPPKAVHSQQPDPVQRAPQDCGSQEGAPPKVVHNQHPHPDPVQRGPQDCESQEAAPPKVASNQPSQPLPLSSGVDDTAPPVPGRVGDLRQTPAKELDRFILEHLKPSPGFQKQVSQALDSLLRSLRGKCEHRPSRVSKGGSFGRGTDLRGHCDAQLVIFLNCFKDYKDQVAHCEDILLEMRAQVDSWWGDPPPGLSLEFPERSLPRTLQFRLQSTDLGNHVDVSLVPAFDAVGQLGPGAKPGAQVYSALLHSGCRAGEHAACFSELRRSFVNTRPAKLKSLILLVKHWYHQVSALERREQPARVSLPAAYALELLTIFAWEQGCKKERFSMAEGLRTVLRLVQQHRQLCVYWTTYYGPEDPALRQHLLSLLRQPRPLILDPADPTWNVGQGSWEVLAQEATALQTQACFVNGDGTPVQPWDVMPALLHQTPAADLDKFISEFLQPDRQFLAQVNRAVDTICSFLRENCFKNSATKVLKVVKGGSSAKGTALRGRSDADLVVFLSCFGHFAEQGCLRAKVISEIQEQLQACQRGQPFEVKFEISKWENPRVLTFSLTSLTEQDQSVDFDVLPAFDALGPLAPGTRPNSSVYTDLIHSYHNAGEFSPCFTELQRDFVASRPTKLKSLIRLVKHWYQQCSKMPKGKGSLPPQHGLELLTVYAWEQGSRNAQFSMAEGFRTVLELIRQYRQLCVYWTVNYGSEDGTVVADFLHSQLQKPRPIILDPADPTGNLGHCARWDLLAKEAETYTSALCCLNKDGSPIQPWAVRPAV